MLYSRFIPPVLLCISYASIVYAATAADVIAKNSNLLSQTDAYDIAVVALTAQSPPSAAQQVPSSLQSLTSAIAAARSSLNPTTPTSDIPTEANVARSWGLFANTVEELMDDYYRYGPLLVDTFGQKTAIYNQLLTFNTTFLDYGAFMATTVTDALYQKEIRMNTMAANGNLGGDNDGILQAFRFYT